jgi:hypothetical protein
MDFNSGTSKSWTISRRDSTMFFGFIEANAIPESYDRT